jgi:hypothetical protein
VIILSKISDKRKQERGNQRCDAKIPTYGSPVVAPNDLAMASWKMGGIPLLEVP